MIDRSKGYDDSGKALPRRRPVGCLAALVVAGLIIIGLLIWLTVG